MNVGTSMGHPYLKDADTVGQRDKHKRETNVVENKRGLGKKKQKNLINDFLIRVKKKTLKFDNNQKIFIGDWRLTKNQGIKNNLEDFVFVEPKH